ncbi:MAG: HD-GYP domain-containing protein [Bdellovibrionales bacterium]|nr:HD-GYP domain-containing protein [Bdellovibrionales bacterium]
MHNLRRSARRKKGTVLPFRRKDADSFPELLFECLRAIVSSLEEKDSYTHGHSLRVAEYAMLLGEALALPENDLRDLELSALLHDIGKIGIPDHVLMKPGRLTQAEFEIMKSHPVRTARILEKISALERIIPGVKYHHERWDGHGYPDGLRGEEIPLFARIILIADTYDAMTSTRPYRLALDKSIAFEELRRCSGTQFDAKLVEAFIAAVEGGSIRTRKPMKIA